MPEIDPEAEDPIADAYGVPETPLIEEARAASLPPPPDDLGTVPGASKWPRAKAVAYLSSCPKLPIYVPLTRDEEGRAGTFYHEVVWNGWAVPVPKGRSVYAPAPIVAILQQSMQRYRTVQASEGRAVDMMLITPERPGGLILEEYSDPVAVELIRRGAPLRLD